MRCWASTSAKVRIVLGDTAMTPYSTGTWGSRSHGDGGRRGRDGLPRARRARRDASARQLLQHDPAAGERCEDGR